MLLVFEYVVKTIMWQSEAEGIRLENEKTKLRSRRFLEFLFDYLFEIFFLKFPTIYLGKHLIKTCLLLFLVFFERAFKEFLKELRDVCRVFICIQIHQSAFSAGFLLIVPSSFILLFNSFLHSLIYLFPCWL